MRLFSPEVFMWIWPFVNMALIGLVLVTLIKFVVVLFKADRAIDEIRDYVRRRS